MTNSIQLAIEALILERSAALKLRRSDLVRRAGFKNVAKGLRRLDELCAGKLKSTASLIAGLPAALELPPEVVADAVRQTEQQVAEARRIAEQEEEAVWRAKFQPCAYFVGTTERPSSICMYGISGGRRSLAEDSTRYLAAARHFRRSSSHSRSKDTMRAVFRTNNRLHRELHA